MDELGILTGIIPNLSLSPILINRFIEVEEFIKHWYQKYPQENINKHLISFLFAAIFSAEYRDLNKKVN